MKYKVGDKVVIRNDLECSDKFNVRFSTVCRSMLKYKGMVAKVTFTGSHPNEIFLLDIDNGNGIWNYKTVEPLCIDKFKEFLCS